MYLQANYLPEHKLRALKDSYPNSWSLARPLLLYSVIVLKTYTIIIAERFIW